MSESEVYGTITTDTSDEDFDLLCEIRDCLDALTDEDARERQRARDRRAAWVAFAAARLASYDVGEACPWDSRAAALDADRLLSEYDARVKDGRL